MSQAIKLTLAASVLSLSLTAQAQIIQHWDFNEPAEQLLSSSVGTQPGGPVFSSDLGSTAMTGDGALGIRRAPGGANQSQASLDTSTPLHLRIDLTIRGWNLLEDTTAIFRVGFTNGTGFQQTSDFQFNRVSEGIAFSTVAYGTGAESGSQELIPGLGHTREAPLDVRLEYDGVQNQYSTLYNLRDGNGWIAMLIDGSSVYDSSADRNAGALRLYANNAFDGPGNYFDLESLTLSQIPEPSTYAMFFGGIALLAAFGHRRYRKTSN